MQTNERTNVSTMCNSGGCHYYFRACVAAAAAAAASLHNQVHVRARVRLVDVYFGSQDQPQLTKLTRTHARLQTA